MKVSLAVLTAALCVATLVACSEKPQRVAAESEQAYNGENAPRPLYERTLNQGESRRMSD